MNFPPHLTIRKLQQLSPTIAIVEATGAQKPNAKTVWHTMVFTNKPDGSPMLHGLTRNTTRYGERVIKAEVWGPIDAELTTKDPKLRPAFSPPSLRSS